MGRFSFGRCDGEAAEDGGAKVSSIGSKGRSSNWENNKRSSLNCFEKFRLARKDLVEVVDKMNLSKPLADLAFTVLCDEQLWEWFAGYLALDHTYKKDNADKHLEFSVARNYLNNVLGCACELLKNRQYSSLNRSFLDAPSSAPTLRGYCA